MGKLRVAAKREVNFLLVQATPLGSLKKKKSYSNGTLTLKIT
jgi:hypothetical protein